MRWIVTVDQWGNCLGMGEDDDGVPARGKPEEGDALPMEFWLCDARENVMFEGRCGDIDRDWRHGFEPLNATWNTFRCRRPYYFAAPELETLGAHSGSSDGRIPTALRFPLDGEGAFQNSRRSTAAGRVRETSLRIK